MRITLATDNPFWRLELGSHRRIGTLVNYLAASGNDLSVVFLGRFYEADRPGIASLPDTYRFMAPFGRAFNPDHSPPAQPADFKPKEAAKRFAKQALVEAKRAVTDPTYLADRSGTRWHLALHEPKLRDFVRPEYRKAFHDVCAKTEPEVVIVEYVRLGYLVNRL